MRLQGAAAGRRDLDPGEHRLEDDVHLEHREAGAEAAAAAAAEGDPGVGARVGIEEALRPEGVGLRIDIRVVMDEVGVRDHVAAGLVGPAADLDLADHPARAGDREDRAAAQRLADRGGHVLVASRVDLRDEPGQNVGRADEALEGPGELGGGGLVAGDEQRHQLVPQLLVGHRRAVLVAGEEHHREHVVAALGVATLVDQRLDLLVGLGADPEEAADHRVQPAEALHRGDQADRAHRELEHVGEQAAKRVEALAPLEPEDRPQDHLEGQRLHVGMERDRALGRPGLDLGLGDRGDDAAQRLHPLAVEGRQQQLPLAHVTALVEQQDRVGADDRQQDRAALARVEHLRRGGEDRLDVLGPGHHHEGIDPEQVQGERLAVPRPALLQVRDRARLPAERLIGAGRRGPFREAAGGGHRLNATRTGWPASANSSHMTEVTASSGYPVVSLRLIELPALRLKASPPPSARSRPEEARA